MFALVCFLIMLPMIFSVPLLYVGMLPRVRQQSALLTMSIALMIAIVCWLVFGNRLAFGFDLLHAATFSSLSAGLVQMQGASGSSGLCASLSRTLVWLWLPSSP